MQLRTVLILAELTINTESAEEAVTRAVDWINDANGTERDWRIFVVEAEAQA